MDIDKEIELVYNLLLHPCGYDIDIVGVLWVRQYEYPTWAVEWEIHYDTNKVGVKEFDNALDAARFFVTKRHELGIGLDKE